MEVYLNRIDGIDDAVISMYLSRRSLNRELEIKIRDEVAEATHNRPTEEFPYGTIRNPSSELNSRLQTLLKWGAKHITLLRFIDLSFTVYNIHRGGQDDWDSHACRFNNRIIRSSTRMSTYESGEMSDWYKDKILSLDQVVSILDMKLPQEIEYRGALYVRTTNGYVLKGHLNDKDYRRGLYMLSIPSSFIFRCQLTEFAHVYQERCVEGSANPEVKELAEMCVTQLKLYTQGLITGDYLKKIKQ